MEAAADETVQVRVLGPVEVLVDGTVIPIASRVQRRIVAMLALHVGRVVSLFALSEAIWPDEQPESAVVSLRNQIARLRRLLGANVIATQPPGYSLVLPEHCIDLYRFDAAAESTDTRIDLLNEALLVWRGEPFEEFADEPWAQPSRVRLIESRASVNERRIEALLGDGRLDDAISEARSSCADSPRSERAHGLLMTALARSGRRSEALQVFAHFREALVRESGLEPSSQLAAIERSILDGRIDAVAVPGPNDRTSRLPNALKPHPRSMPFTGRDDELRRLLEIDKEVQAGGAQAVFIGGESGIGKTRLVAEFAASAHGSGSTIAFGLCDADVPSSCGPFRQVMRQLAEHFSGVGGLAGRVEGLGSGLLHSPLVSFDDLTAQASSRFELFSALTDSLAEAARLSRPSLIVALDDMHSADPDSVALLRFLIRSKLPQSVTIVCTFRNGELDSDHPFARLTADLRNDVGVTRVDIHPLGDESVLELVERCGADSIHAMELSRRSGGNPFFLGQLIPALTDGPDLVPTGVRDVVRRRIGELGAQTWELLRIASVIGPEFTLKLLKELSPVAGNEQLHLLETASRAGHLVEVELDRFRFVHAIVREALASEWTLSSRTRMHAQIFRALERQTLGDLAGLAARAYHGDRSGPALAERTLELLMEWGRTAVAAHADDDARRAFERGVELTDTLRPEALDERATIRITCARAQVMAGSPDWWATAAAAVHLAEQAHRPDLMARAALTGNQVAGSSGLFKVSEERIDIVRRALDAQPVRAFADRSQLTARLADLHLFDADLAKRIGLAREAIALARRSNDPASLARVLTWTAGVLTCPTEIHDARTRMDELEDVLESLDDRSLAVGAAYMRASEYARYGDLAGVDRCISSLDEAVERGSVHAARTQSVIQSYRSLAIGDVENARQSADDARRHGLRSNYEGTNLIWQSQQSSLAFAGTSVKPVTSTAEGRFSRPSLDGPFRVLGQVARGDVDEAMSALRLAVADSFAGLPHDFLWWGGMSAWCAAVFFMQLRGVADPCVAAAGTELADQLAPHRGTFVAAQLSLEVPIDASIGQAMFAAHRLPEALVATEAALELCTRTGVTRHGASTQAQLAYLLLRQRNVTNADRGRATGLLDECEIWARTHGITIPTGLPGLARALLATSPST